MRTRAQSSDSAGRTGAAAVGLGSLLGALAILLALFASTASSAITHNPEPFSPLDGSGSNLELREVSGVAIDEATGNVFVTDGGAGHERVAILGREGGAPVGLAAPYEIPGLQFGENSGVIGLAFDNSPSSPARGALYVAEHFASVVKKYIRNATTERYELAGELTLPDAAFNINLTVDGSGNLYTMSNRVVRKFDPAGVQLAEYSLFGDIQNIFSQALAVDNAGDLFVNTNGGLFKFPADGSGGIEPGNRVELAPGFGAGVAFDPNLNHVFAVVERKILEFDASSGDEIAGFGAETVGSPSGVAVDPSKARIYVGDGSSFLLGNEDVAVFGPAVIVPTVAASSALGVTGTKATLSGSIDPEGLAVAKCFFEWGSDENGKPNYEHEAPCEGTVGEDSQTYQVTAPIAGLTANGTTYHFRLVAQNANGIERSADRTFQTLDTVTTQPATGVGKSAAVLNGIVRPEGLQYADCVFEYGLTTSAGFESETPCNPAADAIGADFEAHAVSAALGGLTSNATYKFRLSATNSDGNLTGQTLTFSTVGPPKILEVRASGADQSSATLEAEINPRGFGTTYRFEWGPTSAYGHRVPAEFDLFAGSGEEPLQVRARISGLSPASIYHYRVVASSSAGTVASADQLVETLNSCGLPEGRCLELVSPPDVGPVDLPGEFAGQIELHYQTANRPGALAYVSESGTPEATKGAEVLSRATRGPAGWVSSQLSPEISAVNEGASGSSASSKYFSLNEELTCGVVASNQPLTSDSGARQTAEAGGVNLYRQNSDPSSYTTITDLPARNPSAGEGVGNAFSFEAFSQNCEKVVFRTIYNYPGVPSNQELSSGGANLYEWDRGELRSVGYVPAPGGGKVLVPTLALRAERAIDDNAVSADGARVFFQAVRQTSTNPAEVGSAALFVRENGNTTRDISLSETSTADTGARFQFATADGKRVFFIANAGLTEDSSLEGQDLYEYNLETSRLTDLSPEQQAGGAEVSGFIGASTDGSHVYFAARGELVPGSGKTFAENQSDGTYSIYSAQGGKLAYVGVFTARRVDQVVLSVTQTSRVSSDGRYLLFESSADVTGYDSGNDVPEAYIYDSAAPSNAVACISCRQDGKPSGSPRENHRISTAYTPASSVYAPRALAERNGAPVVFFSSFDALAPGAAERVNNVYEWAHGQVFRITTEPSGLAPEKESQGALQELTRFLGASADGADLYFLTSQTLNWEDGDERISLYDARIGGGYPAPPPSAPPCDPAGEGSCQGPPAGGPAATPPASQSFVGAGNPKEKKKQKQKQSKKKKKKQQSNKHKKNKQQKKKEKGRDANGNRRTGR